MNPRQVAELVGKEISRRLERLDVKTFQRGIITATAGNRATVAIEGSAGTIPNILCLTGYSPKIDDKVLVLSIGASRSNFLIVGRLDEDGIIPPVANEVPSGTVNGTNTVFTLSSDYVPGTLAVYLNGVRQKLTDDYTETTGHTITFVDAPQTGSKILVDYLRLTGAITPNESQYGFEWGVTPTESPNGSVSVFTVNPYIGGSMQVMVDGIFQRRGTDFTEQPSAGTITFITELPATGQSIRCSYQRVYVSMGGADMVDGFHASSTPTANKLYPLDSNAKFPASVLEQEEGWSIIGDAGKPAFENGWLNYDAAEVTFYKAAYKKDPYGWGHLRGLVKSGTVGSGVAIFTLPVGYRPTKSTRHAVCAGNAYGSLPVDSSGKVCLETGANSFVFLDGITWKIGS